MEAKILKGLLKKPAFKKKYREAQMRAGDELIMRMRQTRAAAHVKLQRIIDDPNTPSAESLKAIKLLDELADKETMGDIVAHISELEFVAKDVKSNRSPSERMFRD